jgi:carboxymethylenebutenolidase
MEADRPTNFSPLHLSAKAVSLASNVRLQTPLSRRGKGPGLLIFVPAEYNGTGDSSKTLDPEPLQKWAEEGFAVVEIRIITGPLPVPDVLNAPEACTKAFEALRSLPQCTFDEKMGVIGKS